MTTSLVEQRHSSAARVSIAVINKDDPDIAETLTAFSALRQVNTGDVEVVVVDASAGRLDDLRDQFEFVRWVVFAPLPTRGSIPHQRNVAVRECAGDIILFTDAGCVPEPGWFERMIEPFGADGEMMVAGFHRSSAGPGIRDDAALFLGDRRYIREAPTINLAFRREVHEAVGGFDEAFDYGSDVDFTWRATDLGYQIRFVPDAVVRHDWGDSRAEIRRSYKYGRGRARLYKKHRHRWRELMGADVIALAYPLYILSLPLTVFRRLRWWPLLLLVPLARNRKRHPVETLIDHLSYAVGVLREIVSIGESTRS